MAKVIFEFNDKDEQSDIEMVVSRYQMKCALNEIFEFYRKLINDKFYPSEGVQIYVKKDGCVATEEDTRKAIETGELLSGGHYYISQDYIESRLQDLIDDNRNIMDY